MYEGPQIERSEETSAKVRDVDSPQQTLEHHSVIRTEKPKISTFIKNHPKCTDELISCLEGLGYVVNEDNEKFLLYGGRPLPNLLEDVKYYQQIPHQDLPEFWREQMPMLEALLDIYNDYRDAVEEYEQAEHLANEQICINGEYFKNRDINWLICTLYRADKDDLSEWIDPAEFYEEDVLQFETFDNEWQRFYQIIRNEEPGSTLGWRQHIANDIRRLVGSYDLHVDERSDSDDVISALHADFSDLDAYFDIDNLEPRFLFTTIDLLFQAQEMEKEHLDDRFEHPGWEIEEKMHQYRDVGFKYTLQRYIESRLKPRLTTVFEKLKYDAVMDAWNYSDRDYTNGTEITLSDKGWETLSKETGTNDSVETYLRQSDRPELVLGLSKNYFAQYLANDAFYVIEGKSSNDYTQIPFKDFLEKHGIKTTAMNDTIGDYRSLMDLRVRASIKETFGVNLLDLSVKEQFFFLGYLKNTTPDSADTMRRFTSLYGVAGMRTFLALERGDKTLGDHIVAFGQHEEVAGTVFKYYAELLNSAERAEALVRDVSDCEGDICIELGNQVRENIINRAQKDLEKAVRAHDPGEVAAQIENYVAAAKEYVALLQEVGAGRIESVSPESLTEEERTRMQDLLRINYNKTYPEPENEAFRAAVAGSLTKSFSNPNTSFRVLRDNGKIVSYNRFDTLSDHTGKEVSYFGSFNADPAYSGVGGVMLEETIKDRLEDGRPMMAHCDPTQAITKKYIEDGFVATRFYQLAGKPSFEIWRSKDSSTQLKSKEKSIEELLASTEYTEGIVVREQSEVETYPELQNNMGLTRYFTHQGTPYLVFETLPNTLIGEFTPPQEKQKEAA